ncbi:DUF1788 domain-containing protein [Herbaspirillum sp. RTI4]|uniref:BREX protein BrxB domain-containing protein n=1 Tax=Herbaspirillum sp. RTI4 TaxID=3048640 RepID=UPI002AB3B079|nr:BREX protein BrxB domain-containing protein [Herbaspirillum sp. RTI4]MDY7579306.1 DUF1788 domain-containing protein [Herbaspirillum sp. RTI4]MEA9980219.1 DUF1788 domain-containing protein [Herbaspirillum sp. RTI4]
MADRLSSLLKNYESYISLPWSRMASSEERSIFAIYKPEDELKLRARVGEFELVTTRHGHPWILLDITDSFATWLAGHDYAEAYFEDPEYLVGNYEYFAQELVESFVKKISSSQTENSAIALLGCGSLFGITSVSDLVKSLAAKITGRLVVLFPGEQEGNTYRLLDAKNGWGYLATSIKA